MSTVPEPLLSLEALSSLEALEEPEVPDELEALEVLKAPKVLACALTTTASSATTLSSSAAIVTSEALAATSLASVASSALSCFCAASRLADEVAVDEMLLIDDNRTLPTIDGHPDNRRLRWSSKDQRPIQTVSSHREVSSSPPLPTQLTTRALSSR
jgi:hypothetical protein